MKQLLLATILLSVNLSLSAYAQDLPQPPGPGKTDSMLNARPPIREAGAVLPPLGDRLQQLKREFPRNSKYDLAKRLFREANQPISLREFQPIEDALQIGLQHTCLAVVNNDRNKAWEATLVRAKVRLKPKKGSKPQVDGERILIFLKQPNARWNIAGEAESQLGIFIGSELRATENEIFITQSSGKARRYYRKAEGMLIGKHSSPGQEAYFYCKL